MNRKFFTCAAVTVGLAAMLFSACKRQSASEPEKVVDSSEKTSFREVTSKLDEGGNLYLYLSTEQWLDNLSGTVSGWRGLLDGAPDIKPEQRRMIRGGFNLVTSLIESSGIEDVSGVGMSSIATAPGFYRTKTVLHHYKGEGDGFLWTMFGDKPHELSALELLPASTVFASFSDLNITQLWSVVKAEAAKSGMPQIQSVVDRLAVEFERATQLNWETTLNSFGGEVGIVFSLDETKMISLPMGRNSKETMEIPQPGFLIVVKTRDDTVFDRIDSEFQKNEQMQKAIVRVDRPNFKSRTMMVPLPLPIEFRPTIATSEGYLMFASTELLINEALAVKAGKKPGLVATDEFKRLSQNIPKQGNQFHFLSQRVGQTFMTLQERAIESQNNMSSAQKTWMQSFFAQKEPGAFYTVSAKTDEGWIMAGNGTKNPAVLIAAPAIFVPAVLAGITLPAFAKAKAKAQSVNCRNNLRTIAMAKEQWFAEGNKNKIIAPSSAQLAPYLPNNRFPTCPQRGAYSVGNASTDPACTVDGHQLN